MPRKLLSALLSMVLLLGLTQWTQAGPDPALATRLLQRLNDARVAKGLPLLMGLKELNNAASKHSREMVRLNYFSSKSPTPARRTVTKRVALEGYKPQLLSQKIFSCFGLSDRQIVEHCAKNWLGDARFAQRILSDKYSHVGFGVSQKGEEWFLTLVFAGGYLNPQNSQGKPQLDTEGCRDLAKRIWELSNDIRREHHKPVFREGPILDRAAEGHSLEMLSMGYFSHRSPTAGKEKVRQRVELAGGDPIRVSENLYQCSGYPPEAVPRMAIIAWLNSPGHRENLLKYEHSACGIGVAARNGEVYVTQVFTGES